MTDMKENLTASNAPASTSKILLPSTGGKSGKSNVDLNVDPNFTVEDLIALEEENNEIKLENTMLVLELTHHAKLAELAGDDDQKEYNEELLEKMKKMEDEIKLLLDDKYSLVALSDFRINTYKKELTKKNKTIEELTVRCTDLSGNKRTYTESSDGTASDTDVANKAFKKDESSTIQSSADKKDMQQTVQQVQQTEIDNLQQELQRVAAEHEDKEEKYTKIMKRGIETIKCQKLEINKLKDEISSLLACTQYRKQHQPRLAVPLPNPSHTATNTSNPKSSISKATSKTGSRPALVDLAFDHVMPDL